MPDEDEPLWALQFEVVCPDCGFTNVVVSSTETVVEFVCEACEAQPVTSLPTNADGDLIAST